MIRRKERSVKTALLVYVLMILMVIGLQVKAEAQASWGYGWGQGYYPAWGGSAWGGAQYPLFGSFQGAYQWGGPHYTAWGQQPYPSVPASYGWAGYYGQVNGSNNSGVSSPAFFSVPRPGEPRSASTWLGGEVVYEPPSSLTQKSWETGIGYSDNLTIGPFDTTGITYYGNESYSWNTVPNLRTGLIPSITPQR